MTTRGDLDRKLIAAVERLGRALRVARQQIATHLKITLLQLQILEHLHQLGPRRVGLLAEELDVTQPTVSDALTTLEDKDIVERTQDPDDRRATLITLTTSGRRIAKTATKKLAPLLDGERISDETNQAIALEVLLQEIHRLQRNGTITVNRSCLSCDHYQPPTTNKPGYCLLLTQNLETRDLRVDCPDHQQI